jgi:hypothetical protein
MHFGIIKKPVSAVKKNLLKIPELIFLSLSAAKLLK